MSTEGAVRYHRDGSIGHLVFDRPAAHNSMTLAMWHDLRRLCTEIAADSSVRVVTVRGAGGKAFVAGTDINAFKDVSTGPDGLAYEADMDSCVGAFESLPQPTVAIVEGWAVGGGLALAFASDFRIAAVGAKFGSPLARTIGNCLSLGGYRRIVNHVGIALSKRMLLAAEIIPAEELLALGLVTKVVEREAIDAEVAAFTAKLAANAPLTQRVSKEAIRRITTEDRPTVDDLVALIYESEDFATGVRSFLAKVPPQWQGR